MGQTTNNPTVEACVKMVEGFLKEAGLNPGRHRLPKHDERLGWLIRRGTAGVFIVITDDDGDLKVDIFSPILKLPSENILPFYRRCLEMNHVLTGCALCVQEDEVILVSRRPTLGLDYEELETSIACIAGAAESLDTKLAGEFGARLIGDSWII